MADNAAQKMKLKFLPNAGDETEGLNDAGIETYMDEPYGSVARECGQNSRDAENESANGPVRLEFDKVPIPRSDLDADGELSTALSNCLTAAKDSEDEKATEFFTRALKVLENDEISCLRIADFNTRGLRGPCEPGNPFHSLVKAKGVSTKERRDSGGSFGIGKNAAYAISELRTVFYSTLYPDASGETFLAQGKSILTSHRADGEPRRATGYWGDEERLPDEYLPVKGMSNAPTWSHRDEIGTTLHSVAFRETEDWAERMAATVLVNFVVALHREELEFKIDSGRIVMNKESISELLGNASIEEAAKNMSVHDDLKNARALYECITATETVIEELEIDGLGPVAIRVLVREGMPKQLSVVRNGMIITDSLENFGDKFRSFPMYRDFVAMIEPLSKDASGLIKRLENPRHDSLSAEQIPDPEKRKAADQAMRALAKQARAAIRSLAVSKPDDVEQIDELAEFFASDDYGTEEPGSKEEDPERFTYKPKKRVRRSQAPKTKGLNGLGGNAKGTGGTADGGGEGEGDGKGGKGPRLQQVSLVDTRTLVPSDENGGARTVLFTPKRGGKLRLRIYATALQTSERVLIEDSSTGTVIEGDLHFDATAGQRAEVDVSLEDAYAGPIEVLAFAEIKEAATNEG